MPKPGPQSARPDPRLPRLPNVWQLTKAGVQLFWRYRRIFAGLTIIYGLLNLLLVQGLANSSGDVGSLKQTLNQAFAGHFSGLFSGLTVFVVLVGSAGNSSSQTAGAYQIFLVLLTSLAIIWCLRQIMAAKGVARLRLRDAYYLGVYPLVPFILVLLVIGLELMPMIIGAGLYGMVVGGGIAVLLIEKILWGLLAILLSALSLYWISSSLIALYIVTLPDMTPLKALRSARDLVRHRRLSVLRKILFLPVLLLIGAAAIMLPIIIWLTPLAAWVFFVLTMFSLTAIHIYMYKLYRELLNE